MRRAAAWRAADKLCRVYCQSNACLRWRLLTEEEHCALVAKFRKGINHPGGSDLIYYPELVGLPKEPTVDEIVDLAIKGV